MTSPKRKIVKISSARRLEKKFDLLTGEFEKLSNYTSQVINTSLSQVSKALRQMNHQITRLNVAVVWDSLTYGVKHLPTCDQMKIREAKCSCRADAMLEIIQMINKELEIKKPESTEPPPAPSPSNNEPPTAS